MPDHRCSLTCIGKLVRKKRARQARVGAGGLKFFVAADMVCMKARVDDELNRFRTESCDLGKNLVGQFSGAGINDECALWSGLYSNVGAISRQHVDVACNVKHMNVSV